MCDRDVSLGDHIYELVRLEMDTETVTRANITVLKEESTSYIYRKPLIFAPWFKEILNLNISANKQNKIN